MKFFQIVSVALVLMACPGPPKTASQTGLNTNSVVVGDVIATNTDSLIFNRLVEAVKERNVTPQKQIMEVARFFLATPYVASTLENHGEEQLVVNLRQMDCTTFVEYVMAASLCLRQETCDFGGFSRHLTQLRYRQGRLDGYPSRLHYFTDWLHDNHEKGLIGIVSNTIGDSVLNAPVDFMSSHPQFYKQLDNPHYLESIKIQEKQVSEYGMRFISKSRIGDTESLIKDGDIIALVTTIQGLDVSHVGLACFVEGRLHFIHASSSEKKVVITDEPLVDFLQPQQRIRGIMVGRLK